MLIRFRIEDGTEYPQWEEKRLGSISEIYQPQTISQSECTGGKYPVYGANGLIGYYHKYNHDKEQVAICCRGASCGKVNLVPEKSWITGNAMVINVDKSNINKKYLYELLSFQNLSYMVCGSGQPQITREPCISHKVYIPCFEEQQKIADFLSTVDQKIEKQKAIVADYEELKKGTMQKIFNQEIRFKDDDGNEFPDWEEKKLGEVSYLRGRIGFRGYTREDIVEIDGVISLSPTNIKNGFVNCDNGTYISQEKYEESPEIKVKDKDILFTKTGSTIGKIGFIKKLTESATINPQIALITANRINPYYLFLVMNTNVNKTFVRSITVGGVVPTLSQEELKKMIIPCPCTKEQKKIADCLSALDRKIEAEKKILADLEELKKGLLQGIFNN